MSVNFSLEGKTALVTGASYGIGFAIASGLAEAGATIVFNDIKQELVDKGVAAYKEAGIDAHGYVCDVTNEEQVNEMAAKIAKEVAPMRNWRTHISFHVIYGVRKIFSAGMSFIPGIW